MLITYCKKGILTPSQQDSRDRPSPDREPTKRGIDETSQPSFCPHGLFCPPNTLSEYNPFSLLLVGVGSMAYGIVTSATNMVWYGILTAAILQVYWYPNQNLQHSDKFSAFAICAWWYGFLNSLSWNACRHYLKAAKESNRASITITDGLPSSNKEAELRVTASTNWTCGMWKPILATLAFAPLSTLASLANKYRHAASRYEIRIEACRGVILSFVYLRMTFVSRL